ncbi:MAG: hypothetical protein RIC95_09465 [Vicingaceae bacterium]
MCSELIEFKKLADEGKEEYQWDIGMRYFYGEDMPEDKIKAYRYLLKSAKQGYSLALKDIGYLYAERKDRNHLAAKYLESAIENYHSNFKDYMNLYCTAHDLAVVYHDLGDYKNAYKWFRKVADETKDKEAKNSAIDMVQYYIGKVVKFRKDPSEGIEFINTYETS